MSDQQKTYSINDVDLFYKDKRIDGFIDDSPIELNSNGYTYEESVLLHAKDTRFNLKGKKEYPTGELLTFTNGRVTKEFKLIKCKYNPSKNTTFIKGIVL